MAESFPCCGERSRLKYLIFIFIFSWTTTSGFSFEVAEKHQSLREPYWGDISYLRITPNFDEILLLTEGGSFSIGYFDSSDENVAQTRLTPSYQQLSDCKTDIAQGGRCSFNSDLLIQNIFSSSCKLRVTLKDYRGKIVSETWREWGNCSKQTRKDEFSYVGDISIQEKSVEFQYPFILPIGYNVSTQVDNRDAGNRVDLLMVGKDIHGDIIWYDYQSKHDRKFGIIAEIKPWIWQQLCQVNFILDPKDRFAEENEKDNYKVEYFGECKRSSTSNTYSELASWGRIIDDQVEIHLINLGEKGTTGQVGHVEYQVRFIGENGEIISNEFRYIREDLFPYGGRILKYLYYPHNAIKIEITIDPNNRITEKDLFNNHFELIISQDEE